jgi:hypothetical protein
MKNINTFNKFKKIKRFNLYDVWDFVLKKLFFEELFGFLMRFGDVEASERRR